MFEENLIIYRTPDTRGPSRRVESRNVVTSVPKTSRQVLVGARKNLSTSRNRLKRSVMNSRKILRQIGKFAARRQDQIRRKLANISRLTKFKRNLEKAKIRIDRSIDKRVGEKVNNALSVLYKRLTLKNDRFGAKINVNKLTINPATDLATGAFRLNANAELGPLTVSSAFRQEGGYELTATINFLNNALKIKTPKFNVTFTYEQADDGTRQLKGGGSVNLGRKKGLLGLNIGFKNKQDWSSGFSYTNLIGGRRIVCSFNFSSTSKPYVDTGSSIATRRNPELKGVLSLSLTL